ncbi:heme A synthase [Massilia arenosa]|uniref:Heme A synthase n=1 Tax=Zemynaea arenosa TaxID=2561931 RepID=A0A4Y9SCF0_9BURK|nr:COX15/CtaA family protein [Massilia arenosa]TFW19747.1 heme A synthase [Massilia arenosa]
MAPWSLFLLSLTALVIAVVPLLWVLRSPDPNKYRKLVRVCMFLTFDLVVFGAFTRLTDSGLGCPDWPGCYGLANPFLAHEHIARAEELLPTGPVTVFKAWVEMIHRFFAMTIGLLATAVLVWSWRRWRATGDKVYSIGVPLLTFLWICLTGAFGRWTVTLKLQPVIVTGHLLLGMSTLALFTWLASRQDRVPADPTQTAAQLARVRMLALLTAVVVVVQVALGGWVSTNYATLACTEYPTCAGRMVPAMDFEHGFHLWRELGKTAAGHYLPFQALTAIHWVHRNFALVVFLVAGYTAARAMRVPALRAPGRGIMWVLLAQAATGIATIYLSSPLVIAVLHNAGAALLVLLTAMLNYRVKSLLQASPAAHPKAA